MDAATISKQRVAKYFIRSKLQSRNDLKVLGIGSGSTIEQAFKEEFGLGKWIRENKILCVPSSFQAKCLLENAGLSDLISDLEKSPIIDLAFDGADEVDIGANVAIKGGGGCMLFEKLVATPAKEFHLLVDERKVGERLGSMWKKGLPIEIETDKKGVWVCRFEDAFKDVIKQLTAEFGAAPSQDVFELRMSKGGKMGPVVTDAGNVIMDWHFEKYPSLTQSKVNWLEVSSKLTQMKGIVAHGLFPNMAKTVLIGYTSGKLESIDLNSKKRSVIESNGVANGVSNGGV